MNAFGVAVVDFRRWRRINEDGLHLCVGLGICCSPFSVTRSFDTQVIDIQYFSLFSVLQVYLAIHILLDI